MHVVQFADAPIYQAPGHFKMKMVRLQGRESDPGDTVWLGMSTLEPGGETTLDTSSVEKSTLFSRVKSQFQTASMRSCWHNGIPAASRRGRPESCTMRRSDKPRYCW
jgi:hypothetical protein